MERLTFSLPHIKKDPHTPRSSKEALLQEIYEHFKKAIPYPMLAGLTKNKGERFMREIFEEYKKQPINTPAYFMGMVRAYKTRWTHDNP